MKRLILTVPLVLLCCSCATMKEENRHLVTWVEENLVPETPTGKLLAAPIVLPVGMAAGILDAFVFHPVTVIDDAYHDTADALWRDSRLDYVTYCGSLPFRTAATPAVFTLIFTGRAMFAIPHRGSYRRVAAPEDMIARFVEGIQSADRGKRLETLATFNAGYWIKIPDPVLEAVLSGCATYEKDVEFCALAMQNLSSQMTRNHHTASQANAILPVARRFAARKEPQVRRSGVGVVKGLAKSYGAALAKPRADATRALISLYDLYVAEKDYAAEGACCDPVNLWRWRDPSHNKPSLAFQLHVLNSLARRKWPVYMTGAAYGLQMDVLQRLPSMYPTAVKEGWLAARMSSNWTRRLALRREARVAGDRERAIRAAHEVIGVREPTAAEMELLLRYPREILKVAETAQKKDMDVVAAADLRQLIARLRMEVFVVDLLDKVEKLPRDQADAFWTSFPGVRGRPLKQLK